MTARNPPNDALRQADRLLRSRMRYLLYSVQEFSAILDPCGTILYVYRTPATPAELIGASICDRVEPHCRDALRAALQRVLQTGEVQTCEVVGTSTGSYYLGRLIPVIEDGHVVAVLATAGDISQQKRIEEGLRDSLRAGASHYRALAEAVPDLVFHLDAEGRFLDFVPAAGQQLLIPPSEFLGRTASEVLPADLARWVMHHIEQALQTGGTQVFQYRLPVPLPDGDLRDFEARIAPSGKNKVVAVVRDVTSTLRTREAVEEGEAKYHQVFEHVHDVFFRTDIDGIFTEVSPSIEWWGYDPEELVGTQVADFYEDPQARPALRETLLEQGMVVDYHVRLKTGDGRVIDASVSSHLLRDPDGAAVGIEGIARDVSARVRAERALRESEERLRTLVANAPVVLFAIDGEGVFTVAEGRAMSLVGFKPEQDIGRSVFEMYRDVPGVIDAARRALAGEAFAAIVETGEMVFEAHVSPVRDVDGKIGGAVAIATDITNRNRAEEALRESEERFRRLAEATLEGIIIHDHGLILDANAQAAAIHGYELSEFIGMDVLTFIAPEWHDLVRQRTLSGYGESYEVRGLRKDGTTFPMEVCGKTTSYEGRQVRVGVARDISERKRAEEAAQAAREELESRAEHAMRRGNPYGLTFRELTVLYLMVAGRADKEIAFQLGISPRTASKHVENILQKMGVASRTEASVRALRAGLVGDLHQSRASPLGSQQTPLPLARLSKG